jgi:hypothetical protein
MARLIMVVAAGLAAGAGYVLYDSGGGSWLTDQAADLSRAAARGAAEPRSQLIASPRIAETEPRAPLRALTARHGDAGPPEWGRVVQDSAPRAGQLVVVPAAKTPVLPRPVAPRLAESGGVRPLQAGDGAEAGGTAQDARRRLAQAIQTELRRVGCYHGSVDGDWDGDTRKAMKAFNDRVNASLPVTQPDYVLLVLLQGHTAKACGEICPAGQAEAENGTCQPRSVLAEARRRAAASLPSSTRMPVESETEAERKVAADVAVAQAERARARADDARARSERERIAAAEERKRQQAAEARARIEAERLARIADTERARAAAEARRRDEIAARSAHEASVAARSPAEIAAPPSQPSPSTVEQGSAGGVAVASADMAPADREAAAHVLTRPADARFVGRFQPPAGYLPPPTYRVGRLPPSPRPRVHAPAVRVRASLPPPRRAVRLQSIFLRFERNSP